MALDQHGECVFAVLIFGFAQHDIDDGRVIFEIDEVGRSFFAMQFDGECCRRRY